MPRLVETGARSSDGYVEPLVADTAFFENALPRIVSIYTYWNDRRGDRLMPRRADIDPTELIEHLPGLLLIDVEGRNPDGRGNFRYRVVGTREVANRRRDPTGLLVEDGYFSSSAAAALRSYESVRVQRAPIFEPLCFVSNEGIRIEETTILLPISENGAEVSQIIVYSENVHDDNPVPLRPYTTGSRAKWPKGIRRHTTASIKRSE